MLTRLRYLWAHNRLLLLGFAAVLGLTLFFGVRTITHTLYWIDPAHQDQPLAAWMTPGYVAMSYDIPPPLLAPALFEIPGGPHEHKTMGQIAEAHNITLTALQARITLAAEIFRGDAP
jgi:hypothetical protein